MFVTGLERGLVPISHAKTSEALDEEQRLLYVALSRAERALAPELGARAHDRRPRGHAQRRARGSRAWSARSPAPTAEQPPTSSASASRSPTPGRARRPKQTGKRDGVRGRRRRCSRALVEWRRNLVRASGVARVRRLPRRDPRRDRVGPAAHAGALLAVPGVGPVKVERYGDAVLALVGEHAAPADRLPIDAASPGGTVGTTAVRGGAMHRSTLPLFPTDDGWPYPDVAADGAVGRRRHRPRRARAPRSTAHAFADLTELEYYVVARRYGLDGRAVLDEGARAPTSSAAIREARDVLGWRAREAAPRLADA